MIIVEEENIIKMVELKIAKSCGSCLHTNKPKKPRDHAAHYEVAKTERWCFKHEINVTRECCCNDHEGNNRASKTGLTRINKFNLRLEKIKRIVTLIGNNVIKIGNYNYRLNDKGLLSYSYDNSNHMWIVRSKESSSDKHIDNLLEKLENNGN